MKKITWFKKREIGSVLPSENKKEALTLFLLYE
jgi:hypothetical protein